MAEPTHNYYDRALFVVGCMCNFAQLLAKFRAFPSASVFRCLPVMVAVVLFVLKLAVRPALFLAYPMVLSLFSLWKRCFMN